MCNQQNNILAIANDNRNLAIIYDWLLVNAIFPFLLCALANNEHKEVDFRKRSLMLRPYFTDDSLHMLLCSLSYYLRLIPEEQLGDKLHKMKQKLITKQATLTRQQQIAQLLHFPANIGFTSASSYVSFLFNGATLAAICKLQKATICTELNNYIHEPNRNFALAFLQYLKQADLRLKGCTQEETTIFTGGILDTLYQQQRLLQEWEALSQQMSQQPPADSDTKTLALQCITSTGEHTTDLVSSFTLLGQHQCKGFIDQEEITIAIKAREYEGLVLSLFTTLHQYGCPAKIAWRLITDTTGVRRIEYSHNLYLSLIKRFGEDKTAPNCRLNLADVLSYKERTRRLLMSLVVYLTYGSNIALYRDAQARVLIVVQQLSCCALTTVVQALRSESKLLQEYGTKFWQYLYYAYHKINVHKLALLYAQHTWWLVQSKDLK